MGTVVVAQAMQYLMKSTGTRISRKSSVPYNCIILKSEVLDAMIASLKHFVYQTK
jgi:hypothetical protein